MLQQLSQKIEALGLQDKLSYRQCSFNDLEQLKGQKFDYIFSNFGGLNCSEDLGKILDDTYDLLNPGGHFTYVVMPVVCPWEIVTLFKGYFKTASRRFKKHGAKAHVEGVHFTCYYYDPSFVINRLKKKFVLRSLKGLSIVVPPPFIEHFIERHPKTFSILEKIENNIWDKKPFNRWCDHYMITMQKQ